MWAACRGPWGKNDDTHSVGLDRSGRRRPSVQVGESLERLLDLIQGDPREPAEVVFRGESRSLNADDPTRDRATRFTETGRCFRLIPPIGQVDAVRICAVCGHTEDKHFNWVLRIDNDDRGPARLTTIKRWTVIQPVHITGRDEFVHSDKLALRYDMSVLATDDWIMFGYCRSLCIRVSVAVSPFRDRLENVGLSPKRRAVRFLKRLNSSIPYGRLTVTR